MFRHHKYNTNQVDVPILLATNVVCAHNIEIYTVKQQHDDCTGSNSVRAHIQMPPNNWHSIRLFCLHCGWFYGVCWFCCFVIVYFMSAAMGLPLKLQTLANVSREDNSFPNGGLMALDAWYCCCYCYRGKYHSILTKCFYLISLENCMIFLST